MYMLLCRHKSGYLTGDVTLELDFAAALLGITAKKATTVFCRRSIVVVFHCLALAMRCAKA